jgi:hypothetical protein
MQSKKEQQHNDNPLIAKNLDSLRFVSLSRSERADIWNSVSAHMKKVSPQNFQFWSMRQFFIMGSRLVAMVLVLVLGLGSGLTYASGSALPGDFLYPFKVHVSEELQSLSKKDSESRASFETERAERRLSEVKTLVHQGSFDQEKGRQALGNFEKHAQKAKSETQKLSIQNPERALVVASNFETTLQTNSIILQELKRDSGINGALGDVVSQVQEGVIMVSEEKNRILTHLFYDGSVSDEIRKKVVEEKLHQVETHIAFLQKNEILKKTNLVQQNAGSEESFENFHTKIQESRSLIDVGNFNQAFVLLHETHYRLEKQRVLAILEQDRLYTKKMALENAEKQEVAISFKGEVPLGPAGVASVSVVEEKNDIVSPDGLWSLIAEQKYHNDGYYEIVYHLLPTEKNTVTRTPLFLMSTVRKDAPLPIHIWSSDNRYLVYEQSDFDRQNARITILDLQTGKIETVLSGFLSAHIEPFRASFDIETRTVTYFVRNDGVSTLTSYTLGDTSLHTEKEEEVQKIEESALEVQKQVSSEVRKITR